MNLPELTAQYRIRQDKVQLSAAAPVRARPMRVQGEVFPHDHDYFEVFLVESGRGIHRSHHGNWPLRPGSVTVLAPGQVHGIRVDPELCGWNIYYLTEWLSADFRHFQDDHGLIFLFLAGALFRRRRLAVPEFVLPEPDLHRVSGELEQLREEVESAHPNALLVRAVFLKILVLLARAYHRGGGEGQSAAELPQGQMIWAALAEIEEALERRAPPEFERIAGNRGITPDHFRRLFKEETGWTPLGFYQQRRIQTAARMLLNPNHTITDVAIELGFSDTPHFSRTFREHQGLSPREYRRIYLP